MLRSATNPIESAKVPLEDWKSDGECLLER